MSELVKSIDITEDNFGLGPHHLWNRKDRQAWHNWAARVMEDPLMADMAGCCYDQPDMDRSVTK